MRKKDTKDSSKSKKILDEAAVDGKEHQDQSNDWRLNWFVKEVKAACKMIEGRGLIVTIKSKQVDRITESDSQFTLETIKPDDRVWQLLQDKLDWDKSLAYSKLLRVMAGEYESPFAILQRTRRLQTKR